MLWKDCSVILGVARTQTEIEQGVSKTRPLSHYQLTNDTEMQAWTSDIHAVAWQESTGGAGFILYSTQSSLYIILASTK